MTRCEACGSNPYFSDNFPRIRDQAARVRDEMLRASARHAREVADLKLQLLEREENQKWLQRKTQAQAKRIKKLEGRS